MLIWLWCQGIRHNERSGCHLPSYGVTMKLAWLMAVKLSWSVCLLWHWHQGCTNHSLNSLATTHSPLKNWRRQERRPGRKYIPSRQPCTGSLNPSRASNYTSLPRSREAVSKWPCLRQKEIGSGAVWACGVSTTLISTSLYKGWNNERNSSHQLRQRFVQKFHRDI